MLSVSKRLDMTGKVLSRLQGTLCFAPAQMAASTRGRGYTERTTSSCYRVFCGRGKHRQAIVECISTRFVEVPVQLSEIATGAPFIVGYAPKGGALSLENDYFWKALHTTICEGPQWEPSRCPYSPYGCKCSYRQTSGCADSKLLGACGRNELNDNGEGLLHKTNNKHVLVSRLIFTRILYGGVLEISYTRRGYVTVARSVLNALHAIVHTPWVCERLTLRCLVQGYPLVPRLNFAKC